MGGQPDHDGPPPSAPNPGRLAPPLVLTPINARARSSTYDPQLLPGGPRATRLPKSGRAVDQLRQRSPPESDRMATPPTAKILHTSDWHLGRTVWGHSRLPDQQAVLAEIVELAANEKPDLILNTGDLFDQQRPPVPAMRLATDALSELATIAPVVVVAGNHDSAALLTWLHGMLRHTGRIHFVADADAVRRGTVLHYPIDGGQIHLAALPFITANRIVDIQDDPAGRRKSYAEYIGGLQNDLMRELSGAVDPERDVTVFAAHQYVSGTLTSKSENPTHTSVFYLTDPEQIPSVNYAAYGHIHKPQLLPGRVVGAYAGSPLQMDFGEAGEDKSAVVVTLAAGTPTGVRRVPLRAGRRLVRVSGTLDDLRAEAPTIGDALCHIVIDTPNHQPDLARQVHDLLPHATVVYWGENAADRHLDLRALDEPVGPEPDNLSLFKDYLAERGTKSAPADEVLQLFGTLLAHVDDEVPELPAEQLLAPDLDTFAVPTVPEGGAA
ncbi:exonuclease SbcCD subunit D [Cryptosporangium sp. NPDC051539]|uniref:exonuclease SbcCD subunit D n=1 Tax=Cryptosporangium sp. NPDC051539 TaxID=3363962 RepID=UPI0037AAD804